MKVETFVVCSNIGLGLNNRKWYNSFLSAKKVIMIMVMEICFFKALCFDMSIVGTSVHLCSRMDCPQE